ncbi:TonB family protein [Phocaeicola coprocola]|uniref:TonB family protein n=1 Tax=Phocaeicola coprocola TaxID=310298 RepID=UPI0039F4A069
MKKSKVTGIIGTVVLHIFVVLLLLFCSLTRPEIQEEGGVPVMLGNTQMAQGDADPYTMTEVDVLPQPETSVPEPEVTPEPEVKQPMITQDDEPSIQVKKEKPKEEKPKKEVTPKKKQETKPVVTKPKEKTEAEKRAEAEKAAAEAAANKIAGAFGKGAQMGNKGSATSGQGVQGKPDGNSTTGGMVGMGGVDFDLNGRSVGPGGLPRPVYNGKEGGIVVVIIVVNPAGKVISTEINLRRTNTVNSVLRKAAEDAARKARFNAVDGVGDQSGTITYYFKLK